MLIQIRNSQNVKPRQRGPVIAVQSGVENWCNRNGMPSPVLVVPAWEGSGNVVHNYAPNGQTGVINGSMPWITADTGIGINQPGTAYNYINYGNSSGFHFTDTSPITVFGIGTIGGGAGTHRNFLRKDINSGNRPLILFRVSNANKLDFTFGDTTYVLGSLVSNATLSVGSAYRSFAGVRNISEDKIYLYIDGNEDVNGTDQSTGTWTTSTGDLQTTLEDTQEPWNGDICLQLLFKCALSSTQIALLDEQPYAMLEPRPVPIYFDLGAPPSISIPIVMKYYRNMRKD